MSRVRINSFEELTIELVQQLDGSSSCTIKETKQLDIETTDSVISNIMPCSYPNPEQLLMGLEEKFGRVWENNLNIQEAKEAFIASMVKKSY